MIDIAGLTKKFGDLTAVDNLTLHVDDGEVFGFLGPNDAEKQQKSECFAAVLSYQAIRGRKRSSKNLKLHRLSERLAN